MSQLPAVLEAVKNYLRMGWDVKRIRGDHQISVIDTTRSVVCKECDTVLELENQQESKYLDGLLDGIELMEELKRESL